MAKFFGIPFAASASKSTIPDTDSTSVSWNGGYTANYEYNPLTNKQAKHIERDAMNTLFYEITSSIQQIQLNGVAPYYEAIIAATGPGYSEGAFVSYGGKIWRSKISNNKVIPNANSTANWEVVYGYSSLVAQLDKDGYLGGGGGGGDGYSKEEIDQKLVAISNNTNDLLTAYLIKEEGEIYLLTWADKDRNGEGFFLCNGEKLPYTPEDDDSDPPTEEDEITRLYFGNKLYDLCYTTDNTTEANVIESDFKKRWNIQIDEKNKTIQLPNILGLKKDGSLASEEDAVLIGVGKTSGVPDLTTGKQGFVSSGSTDVFLFKMLPCIYLGVQETQGEG